MIISVSSKGQVAEWLIKPKYDTIYMASGERLIITDSLNQKIVWLQSGESYERKDITPDEIFPFVEGFAVTTKRDSGVITGFYDKYGTHTRLSNCNVTYSMPYFSNQYLLVHDGTYYRYVNTKGETFKGQYIKAYPFANGYASCETYANIQKKKDEFYLLISKDHEQIRFSYKGKQFDNKDIDFISSVNDEDTGIVIAKKKLYYFNGKDRSLSPICAKKNDPNLKNQAELEDKISKCISKESTTSGTISVLRAKSGKKIIKIHFNQLMIPISITLDDGLHTFKKNEISPESYESQLRLIEENGKAGIGWKEGQAITEILPPQFDKLITCIGDKAFVKLKGKCGLLKIHKDETFNPTIKKDKTSESIPFRHKKEQAIFRLDLPKYIPSSKTDVNIVDPNSGCVIIKRESVRRDTEAGNYVQYNCDLKLPDQLFNVKPGNGITYTYPAQILYDDLISPIMDIEVKAWYCCYFDIDNIDTLVNNGELSFSFNLEKKLNYEEQDRQLNVVIKTDSTTYTPDSNSGIRYTCNGISLKEGVNKIIVEIQEEGCPPVPFPFEVTNPKTIAKTGIKPESEEKVATTKKKKGNTKKKEQKANTQQSEKDKIPIRN